MQALRNSRACSVDVVAFDKRTVVRQTVVPQRKGQLREGQKRSLQQYAQHWLPRLLQQQEEAHETYTRMSSFGERLAAEVSKASERLAGVMEGVLAPFLADPKDQDPYVQSNGHNSPLLDISLLSDPNSRGSRLTLPTAEGLPSELAGIVADIQATNQQLRELELNYQAMDSSLLVLQEGAELRDQQTAAYRDALLQLAEDLEQQEMEEAARAAEQARIEAELARLAAEARRAEEARREEQLRRELEELVSAASAVQAAEAGLAVAETSSAALAGAPPVKVDIGVQMQTKLGQNVMLVGSHPSMGSWSLDGALPMTWTDGHVWRASIELPADSMDVEYKAVLCCPGNKFVWEKGSNHKAELQGSSDVSLFHVFQA